MKRCSSCGIGKPVAEFYSDARSVDGRIGRCIECVKAARRARYAADPGKDLEHAKAWAKENPGKRAAIERAYYARNKEARREKARERMRRIRAGRAKA